MTVVVSSGAAGAGAAAAVANAVKASGSIVRVEQEDFFRILERIEEPLVVMAGKSFLSPGFKYLTSYKGRTFFTKTSVPLDLPGTVELIPAKTIWIPG